MVNRYFRCVVLVVCVFSLLLVANAPLLATPPAPKTYPIEGEGFGPYTPPSGDASMYDQSYHLQITYDGTVVCNVTKPINTSGQSASFGKTAQTFLPGKSVTVLLEILDTRSGRVLYSASNSATTLWGKYDPEKYLVVDAAGYKVNFYLKPVSHGGSFLGIPVGEAVFKFSYWLNFKTWVPPSH